MKALGTIRSGSAAFLLGAVLLLQGCAPAVPKPPAFNLYGYQRMAVLPFDNETKDMFLGVDAEEQIAAKIAGLGAVPIIQSSQVRKFIESQGASPANALMDEGLRDKIARKFSSDLFLSGIITSYEETFKEGEPERRVVNSQTGEGEWGVNTYRRVDLAITAKLYDPKTGSLLWSQKSTGWSYTNTWTALPIPGSVRIPPIAGLDELLKTVRVARDLVKEREERAKPMPRGEKALLYPTSPKFRQLREDSLYQAARYLMGDFQGTDGWTPTKR